MLGLRWLWRDWRGGELGVLAAALVLAVAVVSGLTQFTERLQQSIAINSARLLAADRVLQLSQPALEQWLGEAHRLGLRQTRVVNFQSMAMTADSMQLVALKAVADAYPLRGQLGVAQQAFTAGQPTAEVPAIGTAWIDSRLFALLDVAIGDTLQIGEATLRITRVIIDEPDKGAGFDGIGPRVMMHIDDLPATQVIKPGSRVEYRYLFAGEDVALTQFEQWLKPQLVEGQRWLRIGDTQPRVARTLKRAEQFLLLAGALGVGLAGIAIALAARRYSERHFDAVAILKSMGASQAQVLRLHATNLLLLGLVASVFGYALGLLVQAALLWLLRDLLPVETQSLVSWRALGAGALTASTCLLVFALPPVLRLRRVSPLRVLRRDLGAPTQPVADLLAGVVCIVLLMLWYSSNLRMTMALLAGIAVLAMSAAALAWLLLRGVRRVGMQAGGSWRLALAALRRRGSQNVVQVVIFSVAIMLVLQLALVRGSLIDEWRVQVPAGTPNHFLLNIDTAEVAPLQALLQQHEVKVERFYPMIRARLTQIDGELVKTGQDTGERDTFSVDRELNLTASDLLPDGNVLSAGRWWSPSETVAEVSVESGIATRLGLQLGSTLHFSVGGQPLPVVVSSVRELDWESMRPNFFFVLPSHLLTQLPATYINSFYLPRERKAFLNELLRQFPTVTVIELDASIAQLTQVIAQLSRAVELVLGLIVGCGVLVIVSSVRATLDERVHESAMLRALGASRWRIAGATALEFSMLGAIAGALAALAAECSTWILQTQFFDIAWRAHPVVWLLGPLLGASIIGLAGYLTCRRVPSSSPLKVLNQAV